MNRIAASSWRAVTAVWLALVALPVGAMDESEVKSLEAKCEDAREAKLEPLRKAEIARCIQEQGKDPAYCERYWRDYGAASRAANGRIRPRMFDDLPECLAAQKARREYNLEGR